MCVSIQGSNPNNKVNTRDFVLMMNLIFSKKKKCISEYD